MNIDNGFVLDIPTYLMPSYRISPFKTKDIMQNNELSTQDLNFENIDNYFAQRFDDKSIVYTEDGRSAIEKSLIALNLQKNDVVTIFTTTNNLYISSCVTQKIEKYCKWSRNIEEDTKVVLVNHEFGYCVKDMKEIKSLGFPIIEDFAHSFSASNSFQDIGKYADFLIFSFSKYFPIQLGGALVYDKKYNIIENLEIDKKQYIKAVIQNYINDIKSINERRLKNYLIYEELFNQIDIQPTLILNKWNIPAVFMFDVDKNIDLVEMKSYINSHGIESSVFYGRNSYFIPNHQNLEKKDIEYIFTVVKNFLEDNKIRKG